MVATGHDLPMKASNIKHQMIICSRLTLSMLSIPVPPLLSEVSDNFTVSNVLNSFHAVHSANNHCAGRLIFDPTVRRWSYFGYNFSNVLLRGGLCIYP